MQTYKIIIHDLSKSYNNQKILSGLDMELESGNTYCLMGASGIGKTTFLRLLLGLEQPDSGTITVSGNRKPDEAGSGLRLTAVFQEDRLCESFSALENVMMAAGKTLTPKDAYQELCRLLPEESVTRPIHTLSGGMKRRVALMRAILAPSCGILMDEPFTGLDEDTKQAVIDYIREKTVGKLLVVVTHQEEDVVALDGQLITL